LRSADGDVTGTMGSGSSPVANATVTIGLLPEAESGIRLGVLIRREAGRTHEDVAI